MRNTRTPGRLGTGGPSLQGLALVVGVHVALLATAMLYAPARRAIVEAVPLFVHLIPPDPPEPLPVLPPPPPPKASERKPVTKAVTKPVPQAPSPVIAAMPTLSAPPTVEAPPPLPTRPAPVQAAPGPALAPPNPAPPAVVAASTPAAPVPVTPPNFNADYLSNPPPAYPALSRRLGEAGKVLLRVQVDPHGQPLQVTLQQSSGFERLDAVALATVKNWKFVPAKQGTEPVSAWVTIPLVFALNE